MRNMARELPTAIISHSKADRAVLKKMYENLSKLSFPTVLASKMHQAADPRPSEKPPSLII